MAHRKYMSPLLTTSEVARFLNVHINTVRRWHNKGIIRAYRIGSRGDRRFQKADVERFLAEQKITRRGISTSDT